MSPMLRGEALPLPDKEVAELRASLDRQYGDRVVETVGGPWLLVRVPRRQPDFLRDTEEAAETVTYRDLRGFRGVILIGDADMMGVATETFRALLEERERGEREWLAKMRVGLAPWGYHIGRTAQDPKRRLRFVYRVDAESVQDLEEQTFDGLAERLNEVKKSSPGMARPDQAYLVAHSDHVRLDGVRFFTELEGRQRRIREREARERSRRLEERRQAALARIETLKAQEAPKPTPPTPSAIHVPPVAPLTIGRAKTSHASKEEVLAEIRARFHPQAAETARPTSMPPPPVPLVEADETIITKPAPPPPRPSPHFTTADRHPEAVASLRDSFEKGGYRLKERLLVRGVPMVLAAVRDEGYPARVLVHMTTRLDADMARSLIKTARGVGSDLVLAVVDHVTPEAEKVALATNLKTVSRDAVAALRFD